MNIDFLDWDKSTWKGVFYGVWLAFLLLAVLGLFVDIRVGRTLGEYTVSPNSNLYFGETKNFQDDTVAAYTLHTGYFTQSCLNNVSIESAVPSVGEIAGGVFCRGQTVSIQDWTIYIKDIRPEKNEVVLVKTKFYIFPSWVIWGVVIVLFIIHQLLIKYFFGSTKLTIEFDKDKTFERISVMNFNNREGQFVHLIVSNSSRILARGCFGELISIECKKQQKFEKVIEYRSKTKLRWANKNNPFDKIDIKKGEEERLDLFAIIKGNSYLSFQTDNFAPRGIKTDYSFGTYKVRIRVSGNNLDPVEGEFIIKVKDYENIQVEKVYSS